MRISTSILTTAALVVGSLAYAFLALIVLAFVSWGDCPRDVGPPGGKPHEMFVACTREIAAMRIGTLTIEAAAYSAGMVAIVRRLRRPS